jgi:hypothetical protein
MKKQAERQKSPRTNKTLWDYKREAALDLIDNTYIVQKLKELNPFVIIGQNTYKVIQNGEIIKLIKRVLSAHFKDIIDQLNKLGKWQKKTLLVVANAYLNKYLDRLEQDKKIKRILNPLSPSSYQSEGSVTSYKIVPPGFETSGVKSIKKYLQDLGPTYASYVGKLLSMVDYVNPQEYIAKLLEFLFKYPHDREVLLILNNVNKPFFPIKGKKEGSGSFLIENELFEKAELFKFLRSKGISDPKIPLYTLLVQSIEDLVLELKKENKEPFTKMVEVSFDKIVIDNDIKDAIIKEVQTQDGRIKFFDKLLKNYDNHLRDEQKNKEKKEPRTQSLEETSEKNKSFDIPDTSTVDFEDDMDSADKVFRAIYAQIVSNLLKNIFQKTVEILNTDTVTSLIEKIIEGMAKEFSIEVHPFGLPNYPLQLAQVFKQKLASSFSTKFNQNKVQTYFNTKEFVYDTDAINLRDLLSEVIITAIDESIDEAINHIIGAANISTGSEIFKHEKFKNILGKALKIQIFDSVLRPVVSETVNILQDKSQQIINKLEKTIRKNFENDKNQENKEEIIKHINKKYIGDILKGIVDELKNLRI